MKYIFDFDDVLFYNTAKLKEYMYQCIEEVGVPRHVAQKSYIGVREKGFTLKKFITNLITQEKLSEINGEDLCERTMSQCKNFVNVELIEIIKNIGKANCYMVTHGDKGYQLDKIKRTGIASLFSEIIVVSDNKKEAIEKICAKHKNEEVVFIDDKAKHFEDIDFVKCSNLKTILFTNNAQLHDVLPGQCRHK